MGTSRTSKGIGALGEEELRERHHSGEDDPGQDPEEWHVQSQTEGPARRGISEAVGA